MCHNVRVGGLGPWCWREVFLLQNKAVKLITPAGYRPILVDPIFIELRLLSLYSYFIRSSLDPNLMLNLNRYSWMNNHRSIKPLEIATWIFSTVTEWKEGLCTSSILLSVCTTISWRIWRACLAQPKFKNMLMTWFMASPSTTE